MVRWKQSRDVTLEDMPEGLWPDLDDWGSPVEQEKAARRSDWLREHDLAAAYFFTWLPAHTAERRRLAGIPPPPPARRRGPLPEKVRRLLEQMETGDES